VFAGEPRAAGRRVGGALVVVITLYAGGYAVVKGMGRSLGPWSAEMAARVHDAIALDRAVDMTPPPPPPPAPAPPTVARAVVSAPARAARTPRAVRPAPAAPAQAAQLAAAEPAPADFTGTAFVVGSGATFAGGTTTAHGTSRTPATGVVAPGATRGSGTAGPSRARAVSLDEAAWSCPWPAEADAQQVNEQTVVLRASVRADGRAERVDVLSDPGFGFAAAARLCAMATRFEPAHNPEGQPVAALSPPIRVHFYR
jgi:protein TonB